MKSKSNVKEILKKIFKYGVLAGYILLTLVLIIEAALPGNISAGQSDKVGEVITDITNKDFNKEHEEIKPTGIKISTESTDKYIVGDIYHLKADITPSNSSNKSVIYSSSDESIATVSKDGILRLISEGKVIITGEIKGTNIKSILELNITTTLLEDFYIDCENTMYIGEEYLIHVSYAPSHVTNKTIMWSSSDENIATIDDTGHIIPKNEGVVILKGTSSNNIVKQVTVVVKEKIVNKVEVTGIEILNGSIIMKENESVKIDTKVLPIDATNKELKYIVGSDIISVDKSGNILANKNGQTTIKIVSLSNNNISKEIHVKVICAEANFTLKNELENNIIKIHPKESEKIELNKISMPSQYNIEYITNNKNICDITEDGVINGISEGATDIIIKCISEDGQIKEVKFTVLVEKEIDQNALSRFYLMIRKGIGHFGAFFVLAIFASFIVILFFNKKWIFAIISLVLGFIIASLTEIIQLFVPGRSGLFKDVMIDFTGYVCATILTIGIYYIIYLTRRKKYGK